MPVPNKQAKGGLSGLLGQQQQQPSVPSSAPVPTAAAAMPVAPASSPVETPLGVSPASAFTYVAEKENHRLGKEIKSTTRD